MPINNIILIYIYIINVLLYFYYLMSSRRKYQLQKRSRSPCKPLTKRKVCGPRKSCRYPNVYKRSELVKKAKLSSRVRAGYKKKIDRLSKDRLCYILKLSRLREIKKNRIIEGRICGPDKSSYNPKVWSKAQLIDYAYNNKLLSKYAANKMLKEDLCVEVAEKIRQNRLNTIPTKLPYAGRSYQKEIDYAGLPRYIVPQIIYLVDKYPDMTLYVSTQYKKRFYYGIRFNCDQGVFIYSDLITQMKSTTTRFFVCFIKLNSSVDIGQENYSSGHVNCLIYDKKNNTIMLFEPKGIWKECNSTYLENFLRGYFRVYLGHNIIVYPYSEICPKPRGITQKIAGQRGKGFIASNFPSGLCAVHNIWLLDNFLSQPESTPKEVYKQSMKLLKKEEYGMYQYFAGYIDSVLTRGELIIKDYIKSNNIQGNIYYSSWHYIQNKYKF